MIIQILQSVFCVARGLRHALHRIEEFCVMSQCAVSHWLCVAWDSVLCAALERVLCVSLESVVLRHTGWHVLPRIGESALRFMQECALCLQCFSVDNSKVLFVEF